MFRPGETSNNFYPTFLFLCKLNFSILRTRDSCNQIKKSIDYKFKKFVKFVEWSIIERSVLYDCKFKPLLESKKIFIIFILSICDPWNLLND